MYWLSGREVSPDTAREWTPRIVAYGAVLNVVMAGNCMAISVETLLNTTHGSWGSRCVCVRVCVCR